MTFTVHRKELLKDKAVKAAHEKLLPEYQLAKSIIHQILRKKMIQLDVTKKTDMPQPKNYRLALSGTSNGTYSAAYLKKERKSW